MNQQTKLTKGELAERGLDALEERGVGAGIVISDAAGGSVVVDTLQAMAFAKMMSTGGDAIAPHFRNNPGACLRVVMQAISWRMEPYSVSDQTYMVSGRMAWMAQLIHAVIETRAPLKERLDCSYDGEGTDRTCTVVGKFRDGTERSYTSPKIKDIKVKNSPLWTSDPDQQLWYYSSRAWARRWCPDVILGVYTRDELMARVDEEEGPKVIEGQAEGQAPTLRERLLAGKPNREEGHQGHEHVHQTLNGDKAAEPERAQEDAQAASAEAPKAKRTRKKKDEPAAELVTEQPVTETVGAEPEPERENPEPNQGESSAPSTPVSGPEPVAEMKPEPSQTITPEEAKAVVEQKPKNADEWRTYALAWIAALTDYEEIRTRWSNERPLRNQCGVTEEYRRPVQDVMTARCKELGE